MGLRLFPSFVGLNPSCGEKGSPVCADAITLACHCEIRALMNVCTPVPSAARTEGHTLRSESVWRISKDDNP